MRFSTLIGTAALAASASAGQTNYLGFNSGNTKADRSAKFQADFESEFRTAQGLVGAPGTFNAVRLYTNIQAYSQQDPIQAFDAAIATKTFLLLGIWTSGTDNINAELAALQAAVQKHGKALTDLVIGMSIGSEDLYRDSATGRMNKAGVGNGPQAIVHFIDAYRKAFANTPLATIPVGHVDTWDAWVNGTNKQVLDAVDFVGVDEYPYYESGKGNDIGNAGALFDQAYDTTVNVAAGKPVWVTETGWPYSGPKWDKAVPSVANAQKYWQEVGCRRLFNKAPTFWYNLRDSNPDNEMKFGISPQLSTTPQFDLKCPKTFDTGKKSSTTTTHRSGSSSTSSSSTSPSADNATAAASHTTMATSVGATGTAAEGSAQATGTGAGASPAQITSNGASAVGFTGAAYAVAAVGAGYLALL